MTNILENPRNGCALHGALQTVQAVSGLIPIVHSNPGCGVHSYLSRSAGGTAAGNGYRTPGTGLQERHIIFGGASRLREQIKNTAKVFEGEAYIVLNSCASAMVGDDIDAMTREAAEQGIPVLDTLIAGFHGDVHYGYEHVVLDLLKQLTVSDGAVEGVASVEAAEGALTVTLKEQQPQSDEAINQSLEDRALKTGSQNNLVNLFGILPGKDLTTSGDLEELIRILEGVGLSVNSFFGVNGGLDQFKNAKNAALTITFSNWGSQPAAYLEEQGVPHIALSCVPMGILEVKELIDEIGKYIPISEERAEQLLKREKTAFDSYLYAANPVIEEIRYGGPVGIVADSHRAIQYAGFLRRYLGVPVQTIIYTDSYTESKELEDETVRKLQELAVNVYSAQDAKEISDHIKRGGIAYLLGSSLEEAAAKEQGLGFLPVSFPVFDRLYLNKTYAGIRGAIAFVEDYIAALK